MTKRTDAVKDLETMITNSLADFAANGGAKILELRDVAMNLQESEDYAARQAGECWGAALGALAMSQLESGVNREELYGDVIELAVQGLDAWYVFAAEKAQGEAAQKTGRGDHLEHQTLLLFASICDEARKAIDGDEGAAVVLERKSKELQRSMIALRSDGEQQ